MAIWEYRGHASRSELGLPERGCAYCRTPMKILADDRQTSRLIYNHEEHGKYINVCMRCGWWEFRRYDWTVGSSGEDRLEWGAVGVLRRLDVADISVPTDELRQHLIAKFDERFSIHPKKYEDIVGGVFKDFGYSVKITSYSRDDGVDIFVFDGAADSVVGVQVKRWRGMIEAAQIREFAGALMLHGVVQGVYVTASDYTKGATSTAARLEKAGLRITLWNAAKFLEQLRIAQREAYTNIDDGSAPFAPFWSGEMDAPLLDEMHGVYD
jgi:restriction system protein